MATPNETPRDLANRMAGWFFSALGVVLIALALAIGAQFKTAAFVIGVIGAAALGFGLIAPREWRVTALDAVLTFVFAFG